MKPDLTKPSRAGLAWILRHREEWPIGFKWDYHDLEGCALAFMRSHWGVENSENSAEVLGLTNGQRHKIFFATWKIGETIQPEDVAAALEALS